MLNAPEPEREKRDWLVLAIASGVVLATVPVARALTNALRDRFGEAFFLWTTMAGLALAAALLIRALRGAPLRPKAWVIGTSAALAATAFSMRGNPIEALHLLEYGAIGALAFRALSHRTRDLTVYPAAVLCGAILGAVDEAIQWLTPRRVWDLRDIGINALAAAVAQLPIAFGLRPDWIEPRTRRSGWRRLCAIGLFGTSWLGVCLAATPPRLAWMARHVPGLEFLLERSDVMLEYGHLHRLPNGTRFRSRLSWEELRRLDEELGSEHAEILRASRDGDYRAFLERFTPIGAPFLHEMRVHLFRRDRYLETAENHRLERPDQFRSDRTVALREHEILEAAFGNTMRLAEWDLGAEVRGALVTDVVGSVGAGAAARSDYESRVSAGLITERSEASVLAIPALTGLAFLAGWIVARRPPRT